MPFPDEFVGRHPGVMSMQKGFEFDHLPEHLRHYSQPVAELANQYLHMLPDSPNLTDALRKLWEFKNLVVLEAARPDVALADGGSGPPEPE